MKKIIFIFPFLLLSVFVKAQWTNAGTTVTTTTYSVGIGATTTPNAQLDVTGITVLGGNNSNLDINIPNRSLSFLENSGKLLIGWNRTQGGGEIDLIGNQGGGTVGGVAFFNHQNNGTEKQLMWLTGDGRLQIGTTTGNPGTNKLAVGGGIIAESVTIKLQGFWPDYVFKKDYTLPSLADLKIYIDQNHHLPEMPSEADVKSDGLNLGEMNKLLLKKVEELTLYLIENQRLTQLQQQQINELKDQMKLLKKQ